MADEAGLLRCEHGGLAAAVGMAAEKDAAGVAGTGFEDEVAEGGAVAGGVAWTRGAGGALVTIGQIDAQDADAESGDGAVRGDQQGRVAV